MGIQPLDVRQGILSMIPDEPMMTTTGKLGTLYLADVHIFEGNSGSPVLVSAQDGVLHIGEYHFLGVISGYYFENEDFTLEIATTVKAVAHANSGVAMIVPADAVKDLIENDRELKSQRNAYVEASSASQRAK